MAVVHSTGPGVVVVEGGAIHHYTTEEEQKDGEVHHTTEEQVEEEERNPVVRSSQAILDTVSRCLTYILTIFPWSWNPIVCTAHCAHCAHCTLHTVHCTLCRTLSASRWEGGSSVLERLDCIEGRVRRHLEGRRGSTEEGATPAPPNPLPAPPPPPSPRPPLRPPVLRKLSELLPQVPQHTSTTLHLLLHHHHPHLPPLLLRHHPQCPVEEVADSTLLPDRLIRTWAAELAQVGCFPPCLQCAHLNPPCLWCAHPSFSIQYSVCTSKYLLQ